MQPLCRDARQTSEIGSVQGKSLSGPCEEFAYPGAVRIAGRIRMFAISLPVPEYPVRYLLPEWDVEPALI